MKTFEVILAPGEENNADLIKEAISKKYEIAVCDLENLVITKRSLDARREPKYIIRCSLTNSSLHQYHKFQAKDVSKSPPVLVIGAGPAGLFSSLQLIELGLKPIVIERGKSVRDRRLDLAKLMKQGILNPESNYCFGEGGAGTFSDGKLYTRSKKRGPVDRVLDLFVEFGAKESIRYDSHPHIGTNKLPKIIHNITEKIVECGGEVHFSTKLTAIKIKENRLIGAETNRGDFDSNHLILATGHSARDIFELLHRQDILLEPKSFALGVRIEHPQAIINSLQYKKYQSLTSLPPASYSLVTQAQGAGVYTFCMCPGGIICPASTNPEEVVVNGWSPSTRGSYFANSGLVVEVKKEEIKNTGTQEYFKCLDLQSNVERKAYEAGGGRFKAPAQRVLDFLANKESSDLPLNSYKPGLTSAMLKDVLPPFITARLKTALKEFINKSPLYGHGDAILVGVESRTSSPVKIPRNGESGMHPKLEGLYPCGEGAGVAGGIVSSAIDGLKIAQLVKAQIN